MSKSKNRPKRQQKKPKQEYKKAKKAKKNIKPRPIFICPKCKAYWVHDYYHICTVCGTVGEPQNESAVRLMRWRESNGQ